MLCCNHPLFTPHALRHIRIESFSEVRFDFYFPRVISRFFRNYLGLQKNRQNTCGQKFEWEFRFFLPQCVLQMALDGKESSSSTWSHMADLFKFPCPAQTYN